ncbi:hypothetical protein Q1695_012071 [Nippostrongylus brasiliensis]|nr:hypothetical protein Q1695_012071 [Nippostrongylus brasiliensis]
MAQTTKVPEQSKRVTVAKRVYVPPFGSGVVVADCENAENIQQCAKWPTVKGVDAGVCEVRSQQARIPVVNCSDDAVVMAEGEEIGYWGTEKWKQSVEGFKPLMICDNTEATSNAEERRVLLYEQIKRSAHMEDLPADIQEVLDTFPDSFAVSDAELTQSDVVEMDINTGENKPIKMKARPVPLWVRRKLKDLLEDLEKRKIIEKSSSDWAFPIVLVEKKDGSLRLCVDYRELNKRIKQDSYLLPTIDAILQSMAARVIFRL